MMDYFDDPSPLLASLAPEGVRPGTTVRELPLDLMPPEPVPRAEWPDWARFLSALRVPGEKGVGSTLERLLGSGGRAFKATWNATFGKLGIDCGCAGRRERWDAMYLYQS